MVAAALLSTSGTSPKTTTKRQGAQDWFSWWFQPSEPKNHPHTTTVMAGNEFLLSHLYAFLAIFNNSH